MADILLDVQSAPTTPAAGQAVVYVDSTTKQLASKNDAGAVTPYGGLATPVSVANGGTGRTSLSTHNVLLGAGTAAIVEANANNVNDVLTGFGSSADPDWRPSNNVVTLTDGATVNLNASLGGINPLFDLAAGGDRTLAAPTGATPGRRFILRHRAVSAGRTLTLAGGTGGFRFNSDITALTQTTSGKSDLLGFVYDDVDNKWDLAAVTKGC